MVNGLQRKDGGSPPRAWGQFQARLSALHVGAVHPHVRGDNAIDYYVKIKGKRFTPTCVGTIRWPRTQYQRSTVHPHVRGDNSGFRKSATGSTGSPPRAWGQSPAWFPREVHRRFTPTCVGTMPTELRRGTSGTVHPHVRGDNCPRTPSRPRKAGSPPRAWGQWYPRQLRPSGVRFTPTCVGTIVIFQPFQPVYPVHPHVRGDNWIRRIRRTGRCGSPPRAWGQ